MVECGIRISKIAPARRKTKESTIGWTSLSFGWLAEEGKKEKKGPGAYTGIFPSYSSIIAIHPSHSINCCWLGACHPPKSLPRDRRRNGQAYLGSGVAHRDVRL